jgi:hypothetical protein
VQTAHAVLAECGGPAPEVHAAFREIEGGRLRDLPAEALHDAFTALNRGPLTPDTRFLGGERLGDCQARVLPAFEALRATPDWDTLLLVAHGVVNAVLLSHLLSAGSGQVFGGWQQNPACLNLIDLGAAPGQDLLRAVNLNPRGLAAARGPRQHHGASVRAVRRLAAFAGVIGPLGRGGRGAEHHCERCTVRALRPWTSGIPHHASSLRAARPRRHPAAGGRHRLRTQTGPSRRAQLPAQCADGADRRRHQARQRRAEGRRRCAAARLASAASASRARC